MAEVHHIQTDSGSAGISAAMMVLLLALLIGLAVFAFFALYGYPNAVTPPTNDNNIGINGQVNIPTGGGEYGQ